MLRIGQAQASQAKALRFFRSGATFFVAAKKRTSKEKWEKRTSGREKRTSKVKDLIYVKDRLGLGQPGQGATFFLQRRCVFCSGKKTDLRKRTSVREKRTSKVMDLIYVKDRLGLGQPGQGATFFSQRHYIFCSGKKRTSEEKQEKRTSGAEERTSNGPQAKSKAIFEICCCNFEKLDHFIKSDFWRLLAFGHYR